MAHGQTSSHVEIMTKEIVDHLKEMIGLIALTIQILLEMEYVKNTSRPIHVTTMGETVVRNPWLGIESAIRSTTLPIVQCLMVETAELKVQKNGQIVHIIHHLLAMEYVIIISEMKIVPMTLQIVLKIQAC